MSEEKQEVEGKKTEGRIAMKRYSISLTAKNLSQIEALIAELGFASISECLRGSVHALHTKTFPNYTRPQGNVEPNKVVEEMPKPTKKQVNAQEQANKLATCINVCTNELEGVVAYDEDEKPVKCAYFQYDGRRRYEQEIDIMSVSPELVESQYLPNKDYVTKLQADGNVDYDVNESIEDTLNAD